MALLVVEEQVEVVNPHFALRTADEVVAIARAGTYDDDMGWLAVEVAILQRNIELIPRARTSFLIHAITCSSIDWSLFFSCLPNGLGISFWRVRKEYN